MIDAQTESLISLPGATRLPELKIDGRGISLRSLWRLALDGKLETLKIGNRRVTSHEAIRRMIAGQNPGTPVASPRERQRAIAAAERNMAAAGI